MGTRRPGVRDARDLTAVASAAPQRYVLVMVAKPSARVEELLAAP
jgi:hypothetical protein